MTKFIIEYGALKEMSKPTAANSGYAVRAEKPPSSKLPCPTLGISQTHRTLGDIVAVGVFLLGQITWNIVVNFMAK